MDLIAPVGSAAATRPLPLFGDGGLSVGQVVHARVMRVDGDMVQLRWGDQTVSVASRVPLTVGQQVNLLVEEGNAGKVLLRMVDDTFGKVRPSRSETPSTGRSSTSGTTATAPGDGRPLPIAGVQGRAERDAGGSPGGETSGGEHEWRGPAGSGRTVGGPATPTRANGGTDPEGDPLADGFGAPGPGFARPAVGINRPWEPAPGSASPTDASIGTAAPSPTGLGPAQSGPLGQAGPSRAAGSLPTGSWVHASPGRARAATPHDPLASVMFEKLDGSADRLAGSRRLRTSDLVSGPASSRLAAAARVPVELPGVEQELVARTAMPVYGRLAQSVGGAVAFGQLMAALPQEVGETFARAPLAPADLGRLLIDVGVHPDEMNAVLVGEMLTQGTPVQEGTIRALRRELAAAGGSPRDAAPAVALSRLGLPITPLSLAVARQLLAGQLNPPAAWAELLPELQHLARFAGQGSQAGALAAELLSDWQVPVSDGPEAVGEWLRATIDRAGTPLEAKLARPLATDAEPFSASSPGQDVRARLDLLGQALPASARGDYDSLGFSLQRLQATVQAEQLLNGSSIERTEPRFFAVTLPTVLHQQPSTLQIRVRERDARPRAAGEVARPDIVHLKLSLPGLGDLGVNLTVGQHSVGCHFAAGSSFAEALLTASVGELVQRLKRLGYAHTAVDAAHEPPEAGAFPLALPPRVGHVDVQA